MMFFFIIGVEEAQHLVFNKVPSISIQEINNNGGRYIICPKEDHRGSLDEEESPDGWQPLNLVIKK